MVPNSYLYLPLPENKINYKKNIWFSAADKVVINPIPMFPRLISCDLRASHIACIIIKGGKIESSCQCIKHACAAHIENASKSLTVVRWRTRNSSYFDMSI